MDQEDQVAHLHKMETMKEKLKAELAGTNEELDNYKGAYQHLQGMW